MIRNGYDVLMNGSKRRQRILDRVETDGRASVVSLAEEMEISAVSIRRDLEYLAEVGALRRIRGGAVSLSPGPKSSPFAARQMTAASVKERLAEVAAQIVQDGESVALGSGTACLEVARKLAGRPITVMPFSVQSSTVLFGHAATQLIVPGGWVRSEEGALLGPLAEASVRASRFDTVFLSPYAFSADHGVMARDFQSAAIQKGLIDSSRKKIVIAAASKFLRTGMAAVCSLSSIDLLITDDSVPAEAVQELEQQGVPVRMV